MHHCANHKACVGDALHNAHKICEDKGLRFTVLRRKVLEMIWANHGPAKAYSILGKLKGKNAPAAPPTVYRALDFLLENGLIHKLNSLNAYVGCSHPLKHNACYFLFCRHCGEIKECCNSTLSRAIAGTAHKNKFKAQNITLEIEGECQACLDQK